jgi:uncharacterized protein (TIGR02147 family)
MKVFEFDDYKVFVREKLRQSPRGGHGQLSRIAELLNIHTSIFSHVFNGEKELTVEQAFGVCRYFGLTELETDYFVALVMLARAGSHEARLKFKKDVDRLRAQALSIKNRVTSELSLAEADNAQFYSHWYYMAVKLVTSIDGFNSPESIAEKLSLPLGVVNKALDFLTSVSLCVEKGGKIKPGVSKTHLGEDSPQVSRHHQNWRVKGFEKMGLLKPTELFFTMPATLSKDDVIKLRTKIVEFIEECTKAVDCSSSEAFYCMNIDWYEV